MITFPVESKKLKNHDSLKEKLLSAFYEVKND